MKSKHIKNKLLPKANPKENNKKKILEALHCSENNNKVLMSDYEEMKKIRERDQEVIRQQQKALEQIQQTQAELNKKMKASNEQNNKLQALLKEANLHKREVRLQSQESIHANKETKLILTELRQEIIQLKSKLPNETEQSWQSERRIKALEGSLLSSSNKTKSPGSIKNDKNTNIEAHAITEQSFTEHADPKPATRIQPSSGSNPDGIELGDSFSLNSETTKEEPIFKRFMI